jgi:hypothetical protein
MGSRKNKKMARHLLASANLYTVFFLNIISNKRIFFVLYFSTVPFANVATKDKSAAHDDDG